MPTPSAVVISSSLRESIETEVHEIRRTLRDSFRQLADSPELRGSIKNDTFLSEPPNTECKEQPPQQRILYTMLLNQSEESTLKDTIAGAPSDEELERQPRTAFIMEGRMEQHEASKDSSSSNHSKSSLNNEVPTDRAQERTIDERKVEDNDDSLFVSNCREARYACVSKDSTDDDTMKEQNRADSFNNNEANEDDDEQDLEIGAISYQCEKGCNFTIEEEYDTFDQSSKILSTDDDEEEEEETASLSDCDPNEKLPTVLYQEGATALFNSIETHDWDEASRTLREHPEQAKIWVVSKVSQSSHDDNNDDVDWHTIWKRLPIHEAIRQQAPVALVDQLLQVYSCACRQRTHFGALPLHLALDHGVSIEIVYLILLHHMMAFQTTDQSGRTPLEILNDAEPSLWDPVDEQSLIRIFRSVKRTWQELQTSHEEELQQVQNEYTKRWALEAQSHAAKLNIEMEKQNVLNQEMVALKLEMQTQKKSYEEKIQQLEAENQELKLSLQACQLASTEIIAKMEAAKVSHQLEKETLHGVIKLALNWQSPYWNTVQTKLEESLQTFEMLETTLLDHQDDLETLLQNIGLEPVVPPSEMVDY